MRNDRRTTRAAKDDGRMTTGMRGGLRMAPEPCMPTRAMRDDRRTTRATKDDGRMIKAVAGTVRMVP